ncbi:hypothetical protein CPB85DRAFT_1561262 [Mucidula mucida]|nr:hypothetical protein CPB85DRAFT_1561262 [Mucidula mucida]
MADFTVLQPCRITADGETEDGQPLFNLPFDATSAEAIEAFTKGVKKDAKAALQCPLRKGYDFGMQRFSFIPRAQALDARALPTFAQPNVNQRFRLANEFSEEDPEHDGDSDSWERHIMLYKKLVPLSFAALQSFHDCGIAHNKMHPSNIIIVSPVQNLDLTNPNALDIDRDFSAVIVNLCSHSLLKAHRGQGLNDETKEMDRDGIISNLGACCDSHGAVVAKAMEEATENARIGR